MDPLNVRAAIECLLLTYIQAEIAILQVLCPPSSILYFLLIRVAFSIVLVSLDQQIPKYGLAVFVPKISCFTSRNSRHPRF